MRLFITVLLLIGIMLGCGDKGTGPIKVHWDRDGCDRCRMMLSDPLHAAQIRYLDAEQRSRVKIFDDIGCALIWLADKSWRDKSSTEIWTTDHETGEWIDARTAYYIQGEVTPMGYGVGARKLPPTSKGLTFSQAKAHIFRVERDNNRHGRHLEDRGNGE